MIRRAVLLLAALCGCNQVFGLEAPGLRDGGTDDAGLGAWTAPRPVPTLSMPMVGEEDPFLSPRGDELYSTVRNLPAAGDVDIRVSLRGTDGWLAAAAVPAFNTSVADATPRLSLDGLTLYFSSDRPGGIGEFDVWRATRKQVGGPWQTPVGLADPAVNGPRSDRTLTECGDGRRRVFSSDRDGTLDVFEEVDGVAAPIAGASDPQRNDTSPFISADCLTLYFSADRTGSRDLFVMTRADVGAPFGPPVAIEELSRPERDESDPWVSPDGRYILFSVLPLAMPEEIDIYESSR